jgi:hypothetical protein
VEQNTQVVVVHESSFSICSIPFAASSVIG